MYNCLATKRTKKTSRSNSESEFFWDTDSHACTGL